MQSLEFVFVVNVLKALNVGKKGLSVYSALLSVELSLTIVLLISQVMSLNALHFTHALGGNCNLKCFTSFKCIPAKI